MSRIFVVNHVTLDGVMQGPGRAEEDRRDGFANGGWATSGVDEMLTSTMGARISEGGGFRLLLGRRSYETMLGYWNTQDSPFRDSLNGAAKYVASTTPGEPLPWPNSTVLAGDVVEAVDALKREEGSDLCMMGSGELIRTLLPHRLIDEFILFVHPLVLGNGRRLFPRGNARASFRLVDSRSNTKGVIVAHYELDRVSPPTSRGDRG